MPLGIRDGLTATPGTYELFQNGGPGQTVFGEAYSGPVPGITKELSYTGSQPDMNVTSFTPNSFIHTGDGNDAIDVSAIGGKNILDGGAGSNFLTGGTPTQGSDQFYLDDRNPAAVTWSTLVNFHSTDGATVWGVTPGDFSLTWLDNQGASGYTGLTAVFQKDGVPESGITLAGYTSADLNNGKLAVSWGATQSQDGVPGASYFHTSAT